MPKKPSGHNPKAKTKAKAKSSVTRKQKTGASAVTIQTDSVSNMASSHKSGWLSRTKYAKHSKRLPSIWAISSQASQTVWRHKQLFGGILLVYVILQAILVRGLTLSSQPVAPKTSTISSSLSVFTNLLGSSNSSTSAASGVYQSVLIIIASLAVIWALRQAVSGSQVRIRDSYYRGMYPLVPLILVLLVIVLQLLPMLIGTGLYSVVMSNGIAVHLIEKLVWTGVFISSILLSLYLLCSSLIALYIVTLPDMTPLKALRSARQLVGGRRWIIMRKVIILPVVFLLFSAIIMLPVIIWAKPLSQAVFLVVAALELLAFHAYMYSLYRELLND